MADDLARSTSFPRYVPSTSTAMLLPFLRLLAISGVSLSVIGSGGEREVIASSDDVASRIEELQFELHEGPGYEVVASGRPQQLQLHWSSGGRFPFFEGAMQDLPVSTIITLPLRVGAIVAGVVTLHREDAGLLGDADMATAAALVHWVAGPVVERAVAFAGQESLAVDGQQGRFRREVHQATGMMLVQLDTTASDAFLRLKAYAFAEGRTVEAVAHDVVTRRLDFADLEH
jgi:hypothetical protein